MARQQSKRVTINVTPEQAKAVQRAYERAVSMVSTVTKNEMLTGYLQEFCEAFDIEWPEVELHQGKRTDLEELG